MIAILEDGQNLYGDSVFAHMGEDQNGSGGGSGGGSGDGIRGSEEGSGENLGRIWGEFGEKRIPKKKKKREMRVVVYRLRQGGVVYRLRQGCVPTASG